MRPIHGKPVQYLPSDSVNRLNPPKNGKPGLVMTFDPDMECIEVTTPGWPTLLIPRDAVMYMEAEQECKVGRTGPMVEPAKPEPVVVEAYKPAEGARSSLSASLAPTLPEMVIMGTQSAPEPVTLAPLPVFAPVTKVETVIDAPNPDLRPPPKADTSGHLAEDPSMACMGQAPKSERGMSKRVSSSDRFEKVGKRKPGRPKKAKK